LFELSIGDKGKEKVSETRTKEHDLLFLTPLLPVVWSLVITTRLPICIVVGVTLVRVIVLVWTAHFDIDLLALGADLRLSRPSVEL
jgi:hypothetical protein